MLDFYKDKKVLVTGHTGFKGSWLCKALIMAGANVIGYSDGTPTEPNLFSILKLNQEMKSIMGDVRDYEHLASVINEEQPEIVFHLAAQPIVRESYKNPRHTYETNVMGTVNICEAIRQNTCVKSLLNVTTDKVYENKEWEWGYRENEPLDGFDPYSNSKSCSELVTHCYIKSFYDDMDIAVSTARAGNVIGGGDFSADRIIPDCVRAVEKEAAIQIRNPYSIRPYQHVMEPIYVYMMIAMKQYHDKTFAGFYNVGPDESDCVTTGQLVELFCEKWNQDEETDKQVSWVNRMENDAPHEASYLKLDCSKLKSMFGWKPRWHVNEAIDRTVEWTKIYLKQGDVSSCISKQIEEFWNKET